MISNSVIMITVVMVVLVAIIIAAIFVLIQNQGPAYAPHNFGVGPVNFNGNNPPNNASPGTPDVVTKQCPSGLQSCGDGCIPTNAICCNSGSINGYCLQPTTGCGNGNCNQCPDGQVFCGMFCKPKGEKCCVGDCPDNGAQPPDTQPPGTQPPGPPPREQVVVPSIKIESAKATFKEALDSTTVACTVELSGTATAPECSNIWAAWGDFGEPAQAFSTMECPEWPACTRLSHFEYKYQGYAYLPVTTTWSVTAEYAFIRGEGDEFFAVLDTPVLDTPQTPLNWKNSCAEAGLGNRTWDSIVLTCN